MHRLTQKQADDLQAYADEAPWAVLRSLLKILLWGAKLWIVYVILAGVLIAVLT